MIDRMILKRGDVLFTEKLIPKSKELRHVAQKFCMYRDVDNADGHRCGAAVRECSVFNTAC